MQTFNLSFSLFIIVNPFAEIFVVMFRREDMRKFTSVYRISRTYRRFSKFIIELKATDKTLEQECHYEGKNSITICSIDLDFNFHFDVNCKVFFFVDDFLCLDSCSSIKAIRTLIDISNGMIDFHAALNTGMIHIFTMAI